MLVKITVSIFSPGRPDAQRDMWVGRVPLVGETNAVERTNEFIGFATVGTVSHLPADNKNSEDPVAWLKVEYNPE